MYSLMPVKVIISMLLITTLHQEKDNVFVIRDRVFHYHSTIHECQYCQHLKIQIMKETLNILEYKVGINAIIANFVRP